VSSSHSRSSFSSEYEMSGSCQINGSGAFQATLIRDTEDGKAFYNCTDDSLTTVLQQMYTLLVSQNDQALICGRIYNKKMTKSGKPKVTVDLNLMKIMMTTTKKPAVAWLLIHLPFTSGGVVESDNQDMYSESREVEV